MSTPYPLPPPPAPMPATKGKVPTFGWAAVLAGVLGLLALFLPWFTPSAEVDGVKSTSDTSFHAWNGFLFMIIGPLLLIVLAVEWTQAERGVFSSRFAGSVNPLRSLSIRSIASGAIAIVIGLLAFPVFNATYKIKNPSGGKNLSWDAAGKLLKAAGGSLERGPQVGLWLLFAGGAILLVVGVLGLIAAGRATPAAAGFGGPDHGVGHPAYPPAGFPSESGYDQPFPPAPGYPQQPGYQQPGYQQPGYQQPGYQPAPGFQQPGYQQPGQ